MLLPAPGSRVLNIECIQYTPTFYESNLSYINNNLLILDVNRSGLDQSQTSLVSPGIVLQSLKNENETESIKVFRQIDNLYVRVNHDFM